MRQRTDIATAARNYVAEMRATRPDENAPDYETALAQREWRIEVALRALIESVDQDPA